MVTNVLDKYQNVKMQAAKENIAANYNSGISSALGQQQELRNDIR